MFFFYLSEHDTSNLNPIGKCRVTAKQRKVEDKTTNLRGSRPQKDKENVFSLFFFFFDIAESDTRTRSPRVLSYVVGPLQNRFSPPVQHCFSIRSVLHFKTHKFSILFINFVLFHQILVTKINEST